MLQPYCPEGLDLHRPAGRELCRSDRRVFLPMFLFLLFIAGAGCTTVKPYQRAYLNDKSMQLGKADIEKFDEDVQVYREGASGGGNGKSSGGCGCN